MLPSEMIEIRKAKFEGKFNICNSLRYHTILWFIVENIVVPSVVTLLCLFYLVKFSFLFLLLFVCCRLYIFGE